MHIYTGYFAKHGKHPRAVSIARGQPMAFDLPEILEFAPPRSLLAAYKSGRVGWEQYEVRYVDRLNLVAGDCAEGLLRDGMVLLCWEGPGKNCHRHLLASWLQEYYHDVEELS